MRNEHSALDPVFAVSILTLRKAPPHVPDCERNLPAKLSIDKGDAITQLTDQDAKADHL